MNQTLTEIAKTLKDNNKKVQLLYAFNGTGKTRLSREFKNLIAPKNTDSEEDAEKPRSKILYYNAFTEDLFYWDNDLEKDAEPKLKIQPNSFTPWIFKEQGKENEIITNFQRYTSDKLNPKFNEDYSEVTFSLNRGNSESPENIKISQGEERNLIWSIFYTLVDSVLDDLEEQKDNSEHAELEYIFIDDPVSSLDDNYLIQLAVQLSVLIKTKLMKTNVKIIITTHNPLFYNVLFNELDRDDKYYNYKGKNSLFHILKLNSNGEYTLESSNDSPFSYHLYLKNEIEKAITNDELQKYHFHFFRHILEKLSTFLGYKHWEDLLPPNSDYDERIINLSSHSKHSMEETILLRDEDKEMLKELMNYITEEYHFKKNSSEANQ